METQEERIIGLYVDGKLSEMQIAKHLGISHERVRWVIKKNKVVKRNISEAVRYWYITELKKKEFLLNTKLTPEQERLKLAAVMLYWGEGTKSGNSVAFTNSNPAMVAMFAQFLREVCGVDEKRLRLGMHLYSDHNEKKLKKFWAKTVGIPSSQLIRSHVHAGTKGSYKMKSQYGTVALVYSDTKLLGLINAWIEEYKTSLIKPA